jgi:hypothetical protein
VEPRGVEQATESCGSVRPVRAKQLLNVFWAS